MDKYANELNFPWEKNCFAFFLIYNFTIAKTRIHFAIYEVSRDNSNPAEDSVVADLCYHYFSYFAEQNHNIVNKPW